ncbi:MAG: hypothetical protein A4E32_00559 [Methanomassiliicoccales archaeon PtaU1.Bin124]|nr:MAG: hypothetical protein A4E32_00559 [Methanomassiliicoccales archaeon PtaU1.Bin124]
MNLGDKYTKIVSILLVWCMISSSLLGLALVTFPSTVQGATPSASGVDVTIGKDYTQSTLKFSGAIASLGYNLTIRAGGLVLIENCDFRILGNYQPGVKNLMYYITVEEGGQLIIRNSTVSNELINQNQAAPGLGLLVRNGGVMTVENSTLKFPGHFVVDDAQLVMRNSTITGETISNVDTRYFPADIFNDAPVMLFMSSDVQLYDSRLLTTYKNSDNSTHSDLFNFNYPFAADTSLRNTVTYHFQRNVLGGLASTSTATLTNSTDLTMNDTAYLTLNTGQSFTTLGFDIAGMSFSASEVTSITLKIDYNARYPFASVASPDELWYQQLLRSNNVTTITITPSWNAVNSSFSWDKVKSYALPLMSSQELAGTVVNLTNSRAAPVYVNRIWVDIELNLNTYHNITLAGNTQFLAVNSEIDANNYNMTNPFMWPYNKLTLLNQAQAYLYGTKITTTTGSTPSANGLSPILSANSSIAITPTVKGASDTSPSPLINLVADDGSYYNVGAGIQLNVHGFNTKGLTGVISSAKLYVRYYTDSPFTATSYLRWNTTTWPLDNATLVTLKALPETVVSYDLAAAMGSSLSLQQLSTLDISYINNAGSGSTLYVDRLWVEVTLEPETYIYRWANFNVTDSQGTPVNGTSVQLQSRLGESTAAYYTSNGVSSSPAIQVLDYLDVTASTFNRTNEFGQATIPVLTEIVNAFSMPRSMNGDQRAPISYGVTVLYRNVSGVLYTVTTPAVTDIGFAAFPEMLTQNQYVNVTIPGLVLDKPDLMLVNLGYTPNPIYEGDTGAMLNVTLRNVGSTASLLTKVQFVDIVNGRTTYLGNVTVTELQAGRSVNVQIAWKNIIAGIHTLIITADVTKNINEEDETNNILTGTITVLEDLPQLAVSDNEIYFSMSPAMTGMEMTITATVRNTGRAPAVNATINFYIDDPDLGGKIIGQDIITIGIGAAVNASINWTPSTMGSVAIYVEIVDVKEYNHNADIAHRSLSIGAPVGNNVIIDDPVHPMFINSARSDTHNYIVDNSTLVLNSTLFLKQDYNNQLWIVLKGTGKLVLNGGSVSSDYLLTIYLSGTANMTVYGQAQTIKAAGMVSITLDGTSTIYANGANFGYDINAPSTSHGRLVAVNTIFQVAWSKFGGYAVADLTNISVPRLTPVENAVMYHYRWIIVNTYDGTGNIPLSGVTVYLKNWTSAVTTLYAVGVSDANSRINFKALCDILTVSTTTYYGNYKVNGTYLFDNKVAQSVTDVEVSLKYYTSSLTQTNPTVAVVIPVYLTDVAIFAADVTLAPASPIRNETATISATVRNVGSQAATDVNVSFYTNATGTRVWFASRVIASLPSGQSFTLNVAWTPSTSGAEVITIIADDGRLLNESSRANNQVNKAITVLEVPHVYASGLAFYSSTGTTIITSANVDQTIRAEATVVNNGQSTATDLVVRFYVDSPTAGTLMGTATISSLSVSATTTVSINWVVKSVSGHGTFQNRTVYVVFDKYTKSTDTPVSQIFEVIDNRPDTAVVDATVIKGGLSTTSASPGESVKISFNVTNLGMTTATNAKILVNLTAGSVNYIIYNTTATLKSGETRWFNASWVVNGVSTGAYKMNVWANPDITFAEGDLANNHYVIDFTVATIVNPTITISLGGTEFKPTESIIVQGTLKSAAGLPLENTTVTVSLTDSQGFLIGNVQTTTTSSTGFFVAVLVVPSYDKTDAFVTVKLGSDPSISQSQPIKIVTPSTTAVPWWMILLIVLIIVAVIIIFSVYLYRYGLGKMVECGECGALIPENSKRCPKCGTAFETGTAKCSECGAWIPVNSTECPECHAKFLSGVNEAVEEDAYNKAMKEQYDDYVNEFRERAKVAQGAKYSEERFQEWLKTEPGFLPYGDWVRKKEEEKKAGAFPCPACGTLNPRGSTICHKCGTVFDTSATAEEKPRTFRKIVKRSSEKKTVKKEDQEPTEEQKPPEQQ